MAPTPPTRVSRPRAAKEKINYNENYLAKKQTKIAKPKSPTKSRKKVGNWKTQALLYLRWGSSKFFYPIIRDDEGNTHRTDDPWHDEEGNEVPSKNSNWFGVVARALEHTDAKNRKSLDKREKTDWARRWRDNDWTAEIDLNKELLKGGKLRHLVDELDLFSDACLDRVEEDRMRNDEPSPPEDGEKSEDSQNIELREADRYRPWGASPFSVPLSWNRDGTFSIISAPWKDEQWNDVEPKGDWDALVTDALEKIDEKNGTDWAKKDKRKMFHEDWCEAFHRGGELRELVEKELVSERRVAMWESERRMGINRVKPDWDDEFEVPHEKEIDKGRESSKHESMAGKGNPPILSSRSIILPARLLPYSETEDKNRRRSSTTNRQFEKNVAAFCKAHDARNGTTWYTQWNSGAYCDEWLIVSMRNGALKELVEDGFLGDVGRYGWEKVQQDGSDIKIPYDLEGEVPEH